MVNVRLNLGSFLKFKRIDAEWRLCLLSESEDAEIIAPIRSPVLAFTLI